MEMLTRIENIENRQDQIVSRLELLELAQDSNTKYVDSYANAVKTNGAPIPDADRLERLEYAASEEERRRRQLEVSVSHPSLDNTSSDLSLHTKSFLKNSMKMEDREIDNVLLARKASRRNTVIIKFSHLRFKKFIYTAKKTLRSNGAAISHDLFVNDNLTSYNFSLLMALKKQRKTLEESGNQCISSVYSFDGKVFARKRTDHSTSDAVHIKTNKCMESFMAEVRDTAHQ